MLVDEYVIRAAGSRRVHDLKPDPLTRELGHQFDVRQHHTAAGAQENNFRAQIDGRVEVASLQRFWCGDGPVQDDVL